MAAAKKHGVVVVHGQVDASQSCGEQLALVANGIADTLENAGGRVERLFRVEGERARGSLLVTKPGSAEPEDEFRFVEAYWVRALPPAPSDVVLRWILRSAPRETMAVIRGFWRNAANDRVDDETGKRSDYPARAWLRLTFTAELVILTVVIALMVVLSVVLSPLIYVFYSIAGAGRSKTGGVLAGVSAAFHKVDPFLTVVLGDTWRFVEDGMWSVNIRSIVETEVVAFYEDPEIADISVIAHSAGCGVCYDALAEGRATGAAAARLPRPKRLTLVTAGSAINRCHTLSKHSKTSPYTRRMSVERLDPRITGSGRAPAATPEEMAALRSRFYWLDVYARMDLVPGGSISETVAKMAGLDPCQIKRRPVINEDSLVRDHFGYFNNTDLVTPRLIRAIYGGEYPWLGTSRADTPQITGDRVARRTRAVAALQALRMVRYGLVVGYTVFFVVSRQFQDWAAKDAGAVLNLDLGGVGEAITMALVLLGPILLCFYVYNGIRGWWFDQL